MEFISGVTEENIGTYTVLRSIGKGGMGEVFLVHDPACGREVALKQMGKDWLSNTTMRERFLREARLASQLSHPNIIPIYTIDDKNLFYTMPFIDGETLKSIIRTTRDQSKKGEPLHPIGASITTLIRIFLNICSAIAYSHSKGILHRDLKPENIIIGKFGEVIILDWGLALFMDEKEDNVEAPEQSSHLTQPGKIPGTIQYMAPERAFGERSSIQTDIYSLGIVLYQLLTLQYPFHRTTLKEFKRGYKFERIIDPAELAPDRDISSKLSNIVHLCLAKDVKERYDSVNSLIKDLEDYIEGLPEWIETAELSLETKEDWLFQENIALPKHMAITRDIEMLEWVNLMISKAHFPGNIKIETTVTLNANSKGMGILFCVPEYDLRSGIEDAYCLWLSDEGMRLYRSNVEVLNNPQIALKKGHSYQIRLEKIDNHLRFYLNGVQKFGFLNHIPLPGSRLGLLLRDADLTLSPLKVAIGSQNILINCLAVPDAFLARKNWRDALTEYRKIAHSFPGRAEGREATFRAGMTLVKEAKEVSSRKEKEQLYNEALDEFEKLHNTPGAPLEYLGKSFVYNAQNDVEEEVKCLELGLRKYPKHQLRPILVENILSRFYESSQYDRKAAYHFALLIMRHLSSLPDTRDLHQILSTHLDPLPFFIPTENPENGIAIQLAFWLNRPMALVEMIEKGMAPSDTQNAHSALLQLGLLQHTHPSLFETKNVFLHFDQSLKEGKDLLPLLEKETDYEELKLWALLYQSKWEEAEALLNSLPTQRRHVEKDPLFFLYGCFLAHKEGEAAAIAHLTNISEKAYPPLNLLLSHYLLGRISLKNGWMSRAFFWEKVKLFQQLELFYLCLAQEKNYKQMRRKLTKLYAISHLP